MGGHEDIMWKSKRRTDTSTSAIPALLSAVQQEKALFLKTQLGDGTCAGLTVIVLGSWQEPEDGMAQDGWGIPGVGIPEVGGGQCFGSCLGGAAAVDRIS